MQDKASPARSARFADWFSSHEQAVPGSKPFLVGEQPVNYRELFDSVRRLATFFSQRRIESGERIVIASDDDAVVTIVFIAAMRNGLTAVVIDPQAAAVEIARLIRFSDARMHFVDTAIAERLDDVATILNLVRVSTNKPQGLRKLFGLRSAASGDANDYHTILSNTAPAKSLPAPPDPGQSAYILFTSGTTSTPKGVEISHASLDAQLATFLDHYSLDESTNLLNLLPLHHTDGLTQGTILAFAAAGTVFRPLRFSIQAIPEMLDAVYRYRITHFVTVPSVLALVRELGADYTDAFRTEHFRFIVSTAAYLDEKLWRSIESMFGVMVVNVYGLTETVSEALYSGPDEHSHRPGTIGKPVGCEVNIVDASGNAVAAGAEGELLIRGQIVMRGYFRLPEETAKVIQDGWLHTGDIACVDPDGFYRIVGRKKNMLVVGGINVYPEDIAAVLRAMPGVRDAVVFGIAHDTWGEIPVACLVPADGRTLSESDVQTFFLTQSSHMNMPRQIHFLDELPRGPAGKVLLKELRDSILDCPADEASVDDLSTRILRIAAHAFKMSEGELSLNDQASDVEQWDSLSHVEFLFTLEKELGVKFTPQEVFNLRTIGDSIAIVREKLGNSD